MRYSFAGYCREGQTVRGFDADCTEKPEALLQSLETEWLELTNIVRVILPKSQKDSDNLNYQVFI